MKKAIALLLSLTLIVCLYACDKDNTKNEGFIIPIPSEEITGVPESVVLREVTLDENVTYNISHHYDPASHIDDVELTTCYNGKYGTQTTTYTYAYQYNKSTDLWTLIDKNNGMQNTATTFNNESLKREYIFSGDFNQAHSGTYTIFVENLDLSNMKADLSYSINFNDNSAGLYSRNTFDIYTTKDGKNLFFVIPYTRSFVVRFELTFVFDIDIGIRAN